jgi:hypothetical protein
MRGATALLAALIAVAAGGVLAMSGVTAQEKTAKGKAGESPATAADVKVGYGAAGLPANVAEMREAILAAALSGELDELLIPIQWNELPPDLGGKPVKETLAAWRKQSLDGSGRGMLALLANVLTAPYAARRQGADIENAMIYIWPAFAELPLDKLSPALEVALLRIVTREDARRMKQIGRYDGYGVAIGADGTWHAFKRVHPVGSRPQN